MGPRSERASEGGSEAPDRGQSHHSWVVDEATAVVVLLLVVHCAAAAADVVAAADVIAASAGLVTMNPLSKPKVIH